MDKLEFFKIKRYIRSLCKGSVEELCQNVGLTDYESKLIMYINRNETRIYISMRLGICESKVTKDTRKIFLKIYDYLKRQA